MPTRTQHREAERDAKSEADCMFETVPHIVCMYQIRHEPRVLPDSVCGTFIKSEWANSFCVTRVCAYVCVCVQVLAAIW